MYWDKSDKKYFKKLNSNVGSRKNKFFRRNLHTNGLNTITKIIRLRNLNDIDLEINGFDELPSNICYLLTHKMIKTLPPFKKDVEIVITNTNAVVIKILKNDTDLELQKNKEPINIWYFKKGTIDFLSIKIGDVVNTK